MFGDCISRGTTFIVVSVSTFDFVWVICYTESIISGYKVVVLWSCLRCCLPLKTLPLSLHTHDIILPNYFFGTSIRRMSD